VVAWLLTQERDRPRRRVERFVGVADPDGTLPYAAEEVTAAASHFYDSTVLVGDDIDVGDALLYVVDADVVHLACHAGFFAEFPDLSYIHLAGRGDARAMLWARDLSRLPMRPRLVVLAACHAGTSVALPGNEYVGLPAAFLDAGALTVVAPLWAVDDRSTARFMAALYDELDDASPSVALRRAQRRLRGEPGTAHPYYWAGFQAFGMP
jgi:CHAT domain-containing protein